LIASKNINETYVKAKISVRKLKGELLQSESMGESNISSPPSHHLPSAYSICNEAIRGRPKKCDKLRSPLVAKSKRRRRSTRIQSIVKKVVKKLKFKKIQQKKRQKQVICLSLFYLYILLEKQVHILNIFFHVFCNTCYYLFMYIYDISIKYFPSNKMK
jgi:hypothetical protein